jgi:hypothetical protein
MSVLNKSALILDYDRVVLAVENTWAMLKVVVVCSIEDAIAILIGLC